MSLPAICRPQHWIIVLSALVLVQVAGTCSAMSSAERAGSTGIEELVKDAHAGDVFAWERYNNGSDAWSMVAQARSAASRLRTDDAIALAGTAIHSEGASSASRSHAWSVVADAAFADGRYSEAQEASLHWVRALGSTGASAKSVEDARRMGALAGALSTAPRQAVISYSASAVRTSRDKVGLTRATVKVNGREQHAVLDTGAGLSVVSRTTAEQLGLHLLDASATIDSSTRDGVPTRIGVAETVEFAGLALRDVAFLVLDDAQLELPIPGGYSIPAIVGFPVLRELQRVRFDRDGALVPEPELRSAATSENLRIVGSALYVNVTIEGVPTALHLDSGAPTSFLSSRFAKRHAHFVDGLEVQDEKLAGAGGTRLRRSARLPSASMAIAGRRVSLAAFPVTVDEGSDTEAPNFGVLGGDVLAHFQHWTIDFRSMTLELGDPVDTPPTYPHPDDEGNPDNQQGGHAT